MATVTTRQLFDVGDVSGFMRCGYVHPKLVWVLGSQQAFDLVRHLFVIRSHKTDVWTGAYVKPRGLQENVCIWKVGENAESSLPSLPALKRNSSMSGHVPTILNTVEGPLVCCCSAVPQAILNPILTVPTRVTFSSVFHQQGCHTH